MPPTDKPSSQPPRPDERGPVTDAIVQVVSGAVGGAASAAVGKALQGKQPPKDK